MSSPTVHLLLIKRDILKKNVNTILEFLKSEENVGNNLFLNEKRSVEVLLSSIDSLNEQITNSYIEVDNEEEIIKHNENETLYRSRVSQCLCKLEVVENDVAQLTTESEGLKLSHYSVTPKMKCPVFDSDSLENDKLTYLNFYKEFENCVSSVEGKSLKLIILKNHLKGYTHRILSHLSISDVNLDTAVEILQREFLNKKYIVNTIFKSINNSEPRDSNFKSVKMFLNKLKADI